jgi:transcriptional regulator with XRE-family HTH domain
MTGLRDRRTFPGLLADLREGQGWSQSRLGDEAGYDHSYICKLESGQRTPSRDTIAALAEVLDLSTTDRCSLYICAGFLPDGHWVAIDDWLIRPAAISKERYP